MSFSKTVDAGAVGGTAGVQTYVAFVVCPMGWVNAVDLIQNFIRNFVYQAVGVLVKLEMRKDHPMSEDEVAITCMDGFDLVSKVRLINGTLTGGHVEGGRAHGGRFGIMTRFVQACQLRGLPFDDGKSVLEDFCGLISGGELGGARGMIQHARDKSQRLATRSLGILSQDEASEVMLQHWAGLYCFAASFRRNLFSVGQEIFKEISCLDG